MLDLGPALCGGEGVPCRINRRSALFARVGGVGEGGGGLLVDGIATLENKHQLPCQHHTLLCDGVMGHGVAH